MRTTRLAKSHNPDATVILDKACVEFTHLPARTLAKYLFRKHPGLWSTMHNCRQGILYRRGRHGNVHRAQGGVANAMPSDTTSEPLNPWLLPKSEAEAWHPLRVSVDHNTRCGIGSDFQFPHYDRPATLCFLERCKKEEVGIILINGDLLDFYQLSKFNRDPRRFSPAREIKMANQFLDAIDRNFPHARKIFKLGNHDERLDHYLWMVAAQNNALKAMIEELFHHYLESDHGLKLDSRGWETVRDRQIVNLGRLPVLHGHEFPYTGDSVNPARTLFLKTVSNAIMGDRHRTSEHVTRTLEDKVISCWSIGCLCGLHPYWCPINSWNHGFAIVEIDKVGSYQVTNVRVHNGKSFN